jgi:DNA-binding transcriptional ArsR family regulator
MSGLGDEDLQARVHRALASVSRVRILQLLEAAPRDVAGIATLTGLHANTVRSHLGVLERADLVCRMTTDATGPGRPPVRYRLAPPPPEAKMGGGLETLTEVLIASLLGVADDLAPPLRRGGVRRPPGAGARGPGGARRPGPGRPGPVGRAHDVPGRSQPRPARLRRRHGAAAAGSAATGLRSTCTTGPPAVRATVT